MWEDWIKNAGAILGLAAIVGTAVLTAMNYWGTKSFTTVEDFHTYRQDMGAEVDGISVRLVQIEETIKHQPSMRDIANLEGRISGMAVDVAKMTGINQTQSVMLEAIYNKLVIGKDH